MLIKPTIYPTVKTNQSLVYIPSIPKGFKIIVDTREQNPYKFDDIPIQVIDRKLDYGDYSIEGLESEITIERKNINDFYGSITGNKETKNRDRFNRMWQRAENCKFKGLLIEAPEEIVLCPSLSYSGIHPNSVYGTIIGLRIKNIHVYCGTRESCRQQLINLLVKYFREKEKLDNNEKIQEGS